jgi:hypothetical protein
MQEYFILYDMQQKNKGVGKHRSTPVKKKRQINKSDKDCNGINNMFNSY